MIEAMNIIKKVQQIAEIIIRNASIEAEKIKQGLLQKSIAANEEAFIAEISLMEKRANELQQSSRLAAEQEIKQIMIIPKQQAEKIEINAKNNHQKAVNDVLDMIFNRSEK